MGIERSTRPMGLQPPIAISASVAADPALARDFTGSEGTAEASHFSARLTVPRPAVLSYMTRLHHESGPGTEESDFFQNREEANP